MISSKPLLDKHFLIIGSPDDPRVQGFKQALCLRGLNKLSVVGYQEDWATVLPPLLTPETVLRIESPSFYLQAIKGLMALGNPHVETAGFTPLSSQQLDALHPEQGDFVPPHSVYFGFQQHLLGLQSLLADYPITASMNHIPDMLTFYDKQRCHQQLATFDIAQPRALYDVTSYDELRDRMQQHRMPNVFIKTRFGSGASGIIALKTMGQKLHAQTTLEVADDRLFNSRKLQTITSETALKPLVDKLCQWGVQCEAWIPKASVNGQLCDCRLLVVDGSPEFAVLRKSRTPITNLHLLNERANIDELQTQMNPEHWEDLLATARNLAGIFPKSFHFAPDITVHQNKQRHSVLEINAFGDFIQNIQVNGMNTYQWELERLLQRLAND